MEIGDREFCALADGASLLSLMLDFTRISEVFAGVVDGSVQDDMVAIAADLSSAAPASFANLTAGAVDALMTVRECSESCGTLELQSIRREHTRLFDDPDCPVVPYYEGAFINDCARREGREIPDEDVLFINRVANDADRQYRRSRLKRSDKQNIPGDCMITEMAFLRHLLIEAANQNKTNRCGGDASTAIAAAARLDEFVRLHVRPWGRDFFQRLLQESSHPYFRAVGNWGLAIVGVLEMAFPNSFRRRCS